MAGKTLNFHSNGLTRDTTLVLVFDPPQNSDLFRYEFPVVWKEINFKGQGESNAYVWYRADLGFAYSQIDDDDILKVSAWTEAKHGETTKSEGGPEVEYYGPNRQRYPVKVGCKNTTSTRANLTLGSTQLHEVGQAFDPIHVWTGVGTKSAVTAHFTPIISAYVTRDYKQSQMLYRKPLVDPIWRQDLNELDEVTECNLVENGETGGYTIELSKKI
ncbi:hypothetical protein BDV93DRAFT_546257 [Ceratobasidium sp. AG-I]|nr:hypothetical protein BDV93DRAFT_546257 [Ceratobasidium sp. AG-I]